MGRAFHWMDRAATLAMLDKIVTPDGGVALFHDAHPPVEENGWFKILLRRARRNIGGRGPASADGGHRAMSRFSSLQPSPKSTACRSPSARP